MKIKCQFMELGKPLFLCGTNHGDKLKPGVKGLKEILWDEEKRRAEIISDKGFTYATEPWVFTYEPMQGNEIKVVNAHHTQTQIDVAKAQVSDPAGVLAQRETPQSKVQGKPGRKPKFQGEEVQGE